MMIAGYYDNSYDYYSTTSSTDNDYCPEDEKEDYAKTPVTRNVPDVFKTKLRMNDLYYKKQYLPRARQGRLQSYHYCWKG